MSSIMGWCRQLEPLFEGHKPIDELSVFRILKLSFFNETTPDKAEAMVEHIITSGLNNPVNADAICKYLFIFSKDSVKGPSIDKAFWNKLDVLFNERAKMKSQSPHQFRNFVRWFAAAVRHNRDVHYPPTQEFVSSLWTLSLDLNPVEEIEESQLYSLLAIHYCQYTSLEKSSAIDKIKEQFRGTLRSCLFREDPYPKYYHVWLTLALESTYTPHLSKKSVENYISAGFEPLFFSPTSYYTSLPASEKGNFSIRHVEDFIKYI